MPSPAVHPTLAAALRPFAPAAQSEHHEYDVHFRGAPLVNVVATCAAHAQEQAIDFAEEQFGYVPEITAIRRKVAPLRARVSRDERRIGSGGLVTFRGKDRDEVYEVALDRKNEIDSYRSPAVKAQYQDGDDWVVELRFYGLD